ncbi:MAG: hypothetical protein MOGMAGMI_01747 [Candidatus Omnitrophica bacterium]|nr:hypothetical protein [Candidatus Omnitrophota bacterium]
MRFKDPLFFLLAIPAILVCALYVRSWIGAEAALRYSSLAPVRRAGGGGPSKGRWLPALMRLAAGLLLIAALARPQSGIGEEKTTKYVVDVMISMDISGSMATMDFAPGNRLEAAKIEARRFIEGRRHDRIGLVVFAAQSITQAPLTGDHEAVLTLLSRLQMGILEDGTAIGLGLATAVNRLRDSEAKSKVIVLLTDGVNNAGEIDPITAARLAAKYGIRVYTIGVGKEGVSVWPVHDPRFGTRLLKVETQIDEKTLKEIASLTGGRYFRAQDERGLRDVFKEIDRLEKTEIKVETYTHYEEQYHWFLWPAFFVLIAEALWTRILTLRLP